MTKEELALNFIKKQYGETVFSALYAADEIKRDKFCFLAGYEAAQSDQDETMIAFAKWYHKIQFDSTTIYLNLKDAELVAIFKETQKKEV